jgi:hypothetical protein
LETSQGPYGRGVSALPNMIRCSMRKELRVT